MDERAATLLYKTEKIKERYLAITDLLGYPEIAADGKYYRMLVRERAAIEDISSARDVLEAALAALEEGRGELQQADCSQYRKFVAEELIRLGKAVDDAAARLEELIKSLDENDFSDARLTLKADGAAGAVYAEKLFWIYARYAESRKFGFSVIKEGEAVVSGSGAYARFKFESGVHRAVFSLGSGRTASARISVSVLPARDEKAEEFNDKDVRTDIFHSGGAGGQNVNKVATAVRKTHIPTGITVVCQDERSQLKNRERAREILKQRVADFYRQKRAFEEAELVKTLSSERIRTYDFKEQYAFDERLGLKAALSDIEEGGLDAFVDLLILNERNKIHL